MKINYKRKSGSNNYVISSSEEINLGVIRLSFMQKFYWLIIVLLIPLAAFQAQDVTLSEIPFFIDEDAVPSPYAGGLRAPQFNMADLNLDGQEDLIVFDRDGSVFIPLIRQNDGWNFDPSFRQILPEVETWVLFRDFDEDGIKDIFCGPVEVGIPGVAVYKGVIEDGLLSYQLVQFPERDFNILYFPIGSTVTQVFVSVIDMPEIRDIDGDRDLDIIAFEPSGFSAYLYRNLSVEQGFSLDTLIFELDDNCYGGFIESGFSQDVTLSPDAGTCADFFVAPEELPAGVRHAGSTVLSYDLTGNGLQDLLLGDISFNSLVALQNTGSLDVAHMTSQQSRFLNDGPDPLSIELYLDAFVDDFDQDGSLDLVVSPHERFGTQTKEHIWRYEITSDSDTSLLFTLEEKEFVLDQTVFPGTLTVPEFFDENQDGLLDLLIGTEGKTADGISIDPRLYLYRNTGTLKEPAFTLESDDYLGMSEFATTSASFAPSIGDIDGDGDADMIIGDNNGALYFLENTSGNGSFAFANPVYEAFGIRVGAHARPEIFDINNDGLGDLVIGEQNFNSVDGQIGSLNYFQNIGTIGSPQFESDVMLEPNDPLYGDINLREDGFINNHSTPSMVQFKNQDLFFLASGTDHGFIHLYYLSGSMLQDTFMLMSDQFGNIRDGSRTAPVIIDIDDDGYAELAVGTSRGGIAIYETTVEVDLTPSVPSIASDSGFTIAPNPTNDYMFIERTDSPLSNIDIQLFSITGKLVLDMRSVQPRVDVGQLLPGTYIVKINVDGELFTDKVIIVE